MNKAELRHSTILRFPEVTTNQERLHARVAARLPGRCMLSDKREFLCTTTEVSARDLTLDAELTPLFGEHVVLYIRDLGRLEGTVSRIKERSFRVAMDLAPCKQEKIESYLMLLDPNVPFIPKERRGERLVPLHKLCLIRTEKGEEHVARLLDVSLTGAAFVSQCTSVQKLAIDSYLRVGRHGGRVVRTSGDTISIEFDKPLELSELNEHIEL